MYKRQAPWARYGDRGATIVSEGRTDSFALQVEKGELGTAAGASLTIPVHHEQPRKLIVSAWSRAENVTGQKDRDYALYVDCYYTDGTALYGQTVEFDTGTHDWQYGERTIEPTKPIRNINVYLLFRGKHTGRVWFDDVRVALADEPDANLVPRAGFGPERGLSPIASETADAMELTRALAEIGQWADRPISDVQWERLGAALDEIDSMVLGKDWGVDTERCKRDAQDVRWHVELARACLQAQRQPSRRESRLTKLVTLERPRVTTGPVQYRATTGRVPPNTLITVDSNYEGYNAQPLTDGHVNPTGVHWTRVAWASAENSGSHWIELRFPEPILVHEVRLWAALDAGTLHVPERVEVQEHSGDGWARIEGQEVNVADNGCVTLRLPPAERRLIRVWQAPHGGSKARPDLMWISEVEIE